MTRVDIRVSDHDTPVIRVEMPQVPDIGDTIVLPSGKQFKVNVREWIQEDRTWYARLRVVAWGLRLT